MSDASPAVRPARRTSNERFKAGWPRLVFGTTAFAVVLHATVLLRGPTFHIERETVGEETAWMRMQLLELSDLALAPEEPDEMIVAPDIPLVDLPEFDLWRATELALPTFEAFADVGPAPVPPLRTARDEWMDYRTFAPLVMRPEIRNRQEMRRFLQRRYQPIYEYSGDTGVVQVTFWINEGGLVERAEIVESSGSRALDRLALRLSRVMRFRPAMLAGKPVRILVHMPITFRAA